MTTNPPPATSPEATSPGTTSTDATSTEATSTGVTTGVTSTPATSTTWGTLRTLLVLALLSHGSGVGYLLKDRVLDTDDFVDAVRRVAAGGTAIDPEVISQLLTPGRAPAGLTARELDVLALMAQGLSNAVIAQRLSLSEGSVSKYTTQIFAKLGLAPSPDTHRRVMAVLAYLNQLDPGTSPP
ncbi:response regulator transcription factor [Nonomuraea fuscirosea]